MWERRTLGISSAATWTPVVEKEYGIDMREPVPDLVVGLTGKAPIVIEVVVTDVLEADAERYEAVHD